MKHAIFLHASQIIPWTLLLQWLETYGFPALTAVLSNLFAGVNVFGFPASVIIAWIEAALVAFTNGQPLPPFPSPVKP